MEAKELDKFIMPDIVPGDFLTMSDLLEYVPYMEHNQVVEIINCCEMERRCVKLTRSGNYTLAAKVQKECTKRIGNVLKHVIN